MNAIVAVDEKWGIGRDGALLCHLPGDLKYFKEKTLGKNCVMGRKTLESFPGGRPLPGRMNMVISGSFFERPEEELRELGAYSRSPGGGFRYLDVKLSPEDEAKGTSLRFLNSLEAFTSVFRWLEPHELANFFVCGGASIYEQFLPLCERVYVTKMEGDLAADRFFPDLDKLTEAELEALWRKNFGMDGDSASSDEADSQRAFRLVSESERHEENGIGYRFSVYERKA